jgi:hypothetical protein
LFNDPLDNPHHHPPACQGHARVTSTANGGAILAAAADSLRDVHSIRDFIIAMETGSRVAIAMLDDVEQAFVRILRTSDGGHLANGVDRL